MKKIVMELLGKDLLGKDLNTILNSVSASGVIENCAIEVTSEGLKSLNGDYAHICYSMTHFDKEFFSSYEYSEDFIFCIEGKKTIEMLKGFFVNDIVKVVASEKEVTFMTSDSFLRIPCIVPDSHIRTDEINFEDKRFSTKYDFAIKNLSLPFIKKSEFNFVKDADMSFEKKGDRLFLKQKTFDDYIIEKLLSKDVEIVSSKNVELNLEDFSVYFDSDFFFSIISGLKNEETLKLSLSPSQPIQMEIEREFSQVLLLLAIMVKED